MNELKTVDDPTILSALDIIENGYMNGITVTDVALRLGYDTDHFIKKFRKAMGTTPYAYIKALKLHEAEMLRRNGFTMAQAAERTGYSTPESLYHAAHRKKIDKVKKTLLRMCYNIREKTGTADRSSSNTIRRQRKWRNTHPRTASLSRELSAT